MQTSKEVNQKRAKLVHDTRAIYDRAEAEKRELSAEDKEQVEKMLDEVDSLGELAESLSKLEGAEQNDDEPANDKPEADSRDDEQHDDDKADAEEKKRHLARIEASLKRSAGRASRLALADDNGPDRRNSKRYLDSYRNWLRNGTESRDLAIGSGSTGGYLVTPTKLSDDIVIAINNLVFIRQMATITKVVDAQSLGNPQLTADIQAITWGSETTVSDADSTMAFGRRDLTPIMATNLIKVSYRELQASPRVEELVAQRIALSFAYGEESAYLTGDGSGHPLGLFTASSSGVPTSRDVTATGSSHSIAADDLFNMVYSIPQQYQNSKSFGWIMHRDAVKQCVKLKDSNGQYLWSVGGVTSGMVGNRASTLLGFPVYQSEFAPNTFSSNDYIAVLGDYSYYRIAETMDMEIQRLNELYAASGQIGFLARKFVDGSPVLANAFARLKLS